MSITGTKRADTGFGEKMIGIGEFEVVEINKELDSDGKPIVYMSKSKDGDDKMKIAITLKDMKSGKYFPLTFWLEDKVVVWKTGTTQYINSIGRSTSVDKPENLKEKFIAYPYHAAKVDEVNLVNFLNAWLNIDRKSSYDLTLDWKALMNGSVKELRDLMKSELVINPDNKKIQTVVAMAVVKVVDKEGEIKEYNQIYNREFLAGYNMKLFRTTKFTEELLNDLREKDKDSSETKKNYIKNYEKFAIDITDPKNGIKDAYFLGELKLYDSAENIVATDNVLSEEDATY